MFETLGFLVDIQESKRRVYGNPIPRLYDVRRVPARYQQILPSAVVKYHQCVVLGGVPRALTVGIVEQKNKELCHILQLLTGAAIFPVLIEPVRMRLLIARMERYQRFRKRYSQAYYILLLPCQARLLLLLFQEQGKREGKV